MPVDVGSAATIGPFSVWTAPSARGVVSTPRSRIGLSRCSPTRGGIGGMSRSGRETWKPSGFRTSARCSAEAPWPSAGEASAAAERQPARMRWVFVNSSSLSMPVLSEPEERGDVEVDRLLAVVRKPQDDDVVVPAAVGLEPAESLLRCRIVLLQPCALGRDPRRLGALENRDGALEAGAIGRKFRWGRRALRARGAPAGESEGRAETERPEKRRAAGAALRYCVFGRDQWYPTHLLPSAFENSG